MQTGGGKISKQHMYTQRQAVNKNTTGGENTISVCYGDTTLSFFSEIAQPKLRESGRVTIMQVDRLQNT